MTSFYAFHRDDYADRVNDSALLILKVVETDTRL
jgi:hypothetical protein